MNVLMFAWAPAMRAGCSRLMPLEQCWLWSQNNLREWFGLHLEEDIGRLRWSDSFTNGDGIKYTEFNGCDVKVMRDA